MTPHQTDINGTCWLTLNTSSSWTHFCPVLHFHTPWKCETTFGLLTFSGAIEMENGSTQCFSYCHCLVKSRSSHSEILLRRGVLKICSKCTGEHPWRSVISIKLLCNFIEIILRHGFSPVNLLHIYRAPFPRNTFW